MPVLVRTVFSLILLATFTHAMARTSDQTSNPDKAGTGVIAGRVMVSGRPLAFARVYLQDVNYQSYQSYGNGVLTDLEGRYRFTGLGSDEYYVTTSASGYVTPADKKAERPGKVVNLGDGQSLENVDINLLPGAVITGRVTDAQGRPVIGAPVYIMPVVKRGWPEHPWGVGSGSTQTDDRGVYRAFGLSAGRYTVATGSDKLQGKGITGPYMRAYHPDVTDRAQAKVIELPESGEAIGVDIVTVREGKTYMASGRIVDEAGNPVPDVLLSYSMQRTQEKQTGYVTYSNSSHTDPRGKFLLDGLLPGRYTAHVPGGQRAGFGDPVAFEITDRNISGIEIRLKRGATVSGIVVIEGPDDPAVTSKLSQMYLQASLRGNTAGVIPSARINPDGSFSLPGLKEGKLSFSLFGRNGITRNFSLQRIERNGTVEAGEITIASGEQVSNVKVVVAYGAGVIRGQIRVENGELPQGMRPMVWLRRPGQQGRLQSKMVNARGQFVFDGLTTGEYEVVTQTSAPELPLPVERVFVTSGSESQVTLTVTLDPSMTPTKRPT